MPRSDLPADSHPVGLTYVIAGSRLGSKVLHRRVTASPRERIRKAATYLSPDLEPGFWPSVRTALEEAEPTADETKDIVRGALAGFACFENAFRVVQEQFGDADRQITL